MDPLYGGKKVSLASIKKDYKSSSEEEKMLIGRTALHAFSIELDLPGDSRSRMEAPYPKDFQVMLKVLDKYDSI